MKKILSVALSTAMAFSMFASVAFGETATTPQAKFDALAAKGILNGYPDGQAHLEKDLTRAEFAKIVTKLFGLTEVTGKLSYKDKGYTATNWAVPYIEAVTAANLMQGKDTVKGIFDYNGKVTVEEVAAVLFRALKLETPATTDNSASAWAKGYAQAVINAGLVAQGTNFKANATRSLVVEAAYAVDNLTAVPTVASAEALSPTSVYVTFSDKTTTTVTLTTALVEGVETTINFKNNGHDYTAKVTLAAPKVVSVTTPNAKQLVVKFNRAIDADTVIASDKTLVDNVIAITKLGDALPVTANTSNAELSGDKTELWITLPGNVSTSTMEYLKGQYTVTVTNGVKTDTGVALAAYTTLLTVADTTAPTISSVTAAAKTTINKVTVKVSEPVIADRIIATVDGASATVDYGANMSELVLTTKTLESGKTYNVSLLNMIDFAQNTATPNPATTTVTVSPDVVAPTITSVTLKSERQVEVVFSKPMDKNTLNNAVRVLNADGENKGNMIVNTTTELTPTKLTLTLPGTAVIPNSGTLNTTLVFPTTVKDYLGNALAAVASFPITFTQDKVAPTVSSVTYTSTGLAINFSEKVTYTVLPNSASLINVSTGRSEFINPTDLAAYKLTNDGKTLTFPVTGLNGTYTLRLPEGFVKDVAGTPNSLAATVTNFTVTASTSTDSKKPVVSVPTKGLATGADQVVEYTVTDVGGLNLNTVLDVNNYSLAGKALPTGSYVTTTATAANPTTTVGVSVYIPSNSFGSTDAQRFVVNGIKDTAGNTADAVYNDLSFPDKVKPVLNTAVVSSDSSNRLILTFSEPVLNVSADDFIVKVNGIVANVVKVEQFTTSKYYVTVEAKSGTYLGSKVLFFDLNGNNINGNNEADNGEVVAFTTDKAGDINFNATYISNITVEVKAKSDTFTPNITDQAVPANDVVTGTEIVVK